ncbi:alcohol dehydrogenase catalytic domain-containing protein [Biostraticola tofi]|uniref:Threonine dehydrogenase-like Zn-dependent dehydrogenase n=1 Tax=Biostraticola tofi TaxID=466109 RepID=A0A4R3Z0G2_9GAMM|nr:alcohol dehydrogenase catalytic domain-containing protein [Biostraticola tofi]TCV98332.1 threonine dehydrogenase-like Zn-dependent dehydrogenase [Biostraticola tofi]
MTARTRNVIARLDRPGRFNFHYPELDDDIAAGFIRVKISHCGVCGTDRSFYLGHRDEGYPISLGHEHCGVVTATGEGVSAFKEGERIAIDPNYRCGQCAFCLRRMGHLCVKGAEQHYSNRGYARFIDIHHSYAQVMPDYRSDHIGALIEPLSVALHGLALSTLDDREGDILIQGCGGLGTMLAFALLESSDRDIYLNDNHDFKMDNIRSLYPSRIKHHHSQRQYSLIFEATGQSSGFYSSCRLLDKCARLLVLSRYHADEPFIPERFPWKQPEIKFCHLNGDSIHMTEAARLLATSWSEHHDHLLSFHPFEQINQVFEEYENIKSNKKIILSE